MNRYSRDSRLNAGKMIASPSACKRIQHGVKTGSITTKVYVTKEGDRLDIIAGKAYGNSTLWWVLAAASGIGWGLQVPPGTRLQVPSDITQVGMLVS